MSTITITPMAFFTIAVTVLVISTTTTSVYAGGPRLDWPEDSTDEGKDCWVDGYDAGFAQKYDRDRADRCAQENDEYNRSWGYACIDSGLTKTDCDNIKDNPVDAGNPKSIEEENRRTCYDDGYEDGKDNVYDQERRYRCSEFGDPYRDGFMAACQFGNTYDVCNSFTEITQTQTQEQTNITAGVSITEDQVNRYYVGFDWRGVCTNPLVRNYISQPCEDLVTPDGNALTSQGKQSMESLLCPRGPSILSTIELFYGQIPGNLKSELSNACGWE